MLPARSQCLARSHIFHPSKPKAHVTLEELTEYPYVGSIACNLSTTNARGTDKLNARRHRLPPTSVTKFITMKNLLLILLTVCASSVRAELSPDPDAQAKALERYPQLGISGSPFNQRFMEKVREARSKNSAVLNDPRWPLFIADTVATELGTKPIKQLHTTSGDLNATSGGQLKRIVKMKVDEVATSPFSLEGALIELTGISSIKPQEVAKGEYEITIFGRSGALVGKLSGDLAAAAERSKTLFVSVAEAKANGTVVHIHGNSAQYQGLSTVPTVQWSGR